MKIYKLIIVVLITVLTRFNLIQSRPPDDLANANSRNSATNENLETDINNIPETCEQGNGKKLEKQPIANDLSRIKKCCPIGKSLYKRNGKVICDTETYPFKVEPIAVELYDNCIEDLVEHIQLEISVGNPCDNNRPYIYSKSLGDQLFIIQDGSLLEMGEYGNDSYEITQEYCLDIDHISGDLMALVCPTSNIYSLNMLFLIKITLFTFFSIIFGNFVSIKYLDKKQSAIILIASINALIAYGLHIYEVLLNLNDTLILGTFMKYLTLCYYGCFFIQCSGLLKPIICNFWPTHSVKKYRCSMIFFAVYVMIATLNLIILVLSTQHEGISEMSLFSYQTAHDNFVKLIIHLIIGAGFIFLCAASCAVNLGFYKFNRKFTREQVLYIAPTEDQSLTLSTIISKIKNEVRCCWAVFFIILSNWILVAVTYFTPDTNYLEEISDFLILPFLGLIIFLREDINNWFSFNRS